MASLERLILDRLDEHAEVHRELRDDTKALLAALHEVKLDVHGLKTQARLWGIIAGTLSAVGIQLIQVLVNR